MASMTNPGGASVSLTWYVTGNGGFIVNGVPLSEPLKVKEDPLFVVAVMLNSSAVGQSAAVESKLHVTILFTVKVIGVDAGVVDTAGCCCFCWMFLLWSSKPDAS